MRNIIAIAALAAVYLLAVLGPVPLLSSTDTTGDGLEAAIFYSLWLGTLGAGAIAIGLVSGIAWLVGKCESRNWATVLCGSQVCLAAGFAALTFLMGNLVFGILASLYAVMLFVAVVALNRSPPQTQAA